ncbi:MAG: VWA domain-containing protein [Mycobacterium sp.]|nr:VWA domain-containing protein [Mycobacterium sp.]
MEATLHRFVRLLRLGGVRVSIPEALDAMRCAGQPGVLSSRAVLRTALRVALVKDHRDEPIFDEIFDAFFALVKVGEDQTGHGHGHAHDDLSDTGALESFTLSEEPSETPQEGHEHGKPASIREYFKQEDLAQRYNLHQEANKIDLAALTDQIAFSKEQTGSGHENYRIELEADRLHGAGAPGSLSTNSGTHVDAELTIAEQHALLGWLAELDDNEGDESDAAALRKRLAGVLENLPAALKRHLEALLALEDRIVEAREQREASIERISETERAELEDSLRRLARTLHGGLTHRRRTAASGRVDSGRTMRRNMRFDGVPFVPVTSKRAEDRPRLVVLADVSLSVRATSRFTLNLVHGLQDLFTQVRSFVFVADIAETTELFHDYPAEQALGLIFGDVGADLVDTAANSDYGAVFGDFLAEHSSAVSRRTTVVVLGDGRNNGNDANLAAFEEITRRARETVWLTPEPRYSWGLGACDLPAYAEYCDRVRVVRDLAGLEHTAHVFATEAVGR